MNSFEIYQYLPIYYALNKEGYGAKFICEPPEANLAKNWFDFENSKKIPDELNLKYAQKVNQYAKFAITTQRAYYLSKYLNFKISLQYEVGLNKTNFAVPNALRKTPKAAQPSRYHILEKISRYCIFWCKKI